MSADHSGTPDNVAGRRSLLAGWFAGRRWIPVGALAIFVVIAVVSLLASLH